MIITKILNFQSNDTVLQKCRRNACEVLVVLESDSTSTLVMDGEGNEYELPTDSLELVARAC